MPETKIGSRTYRADKMPASEATRNLARLTKLIGPALPKLTGLMGKDEKARDGATLSALADLIMSSDANEMTDFVVEMAEKAQVKEGAGYENVIYDVHFADDLLEAFQVVAFVLQVNYRSFFGGKLGGLINKVNKAAA